ncbi:MAG: hypothetical protein HYY13_04640 [Nitrospirae bacterium]|nr:hypothetical protein [Nitrospirota bacterium]
MRSANVLFTVQKTAVFCTVREERGSGFVVPSADVSRLAVRFGAVVERLTPPRWKRVVVWTTMRGVKTGVPWVAAVLVLCGACSRKPESPPLAARAGECEITQKDLQDRQEVLKITEEGRVVEPGIVLSHLLKACVGASIMKKHGKAVTTEVLETEAGRIDRETLAPEVLARIKAVFGGRRKAYLANYILPVYVGRVLPYDVVRWSPEIQGGRRAEAEAWMRSVRERPREFDRRAKEALGREATGLDVTSEGWLPVHESRPGGPAPQSALSGVPPNVAAAAGLPSGDAQRSDAEWAKRFLSETLSGVRPGEVVPEVVEMPDMFLVLRYDRKVGERRLLRMAAFHKRSHDEVYWDEARDIPVRVLDSALQTEMVRLVPWSEKFALGPPTL